MNVILKNERGLTLIELLAVVVILGIISAIAVISIVNIVNTARDQAIVANSYTLIDSAQFYVSEKRINEETITSVSYKTLFDENYIEKIKDPDTREYLEPITNDSYVAVEEGIITAVCLIGKKRNLCTVEGAKKPILISELTKERIQSND